jgi:ribonuclease E
MNQILVLLEKSYISLSLSDQKIENIMINNESYQLNDIFIGKTSNSITGLNAAFITLVPDEKNGFIPFHTLNSKTLKKEKITPNKSKSPKLIDYNYNLVQIIREATGNKGPSLTGDICLAGKYTAIQPILHNLETIKRPTNKNQENYIKSLNYLLSQSRILIKQDSMRSHPDFLEKENRILKTHWTKVINRFKKINKPCLIGRQRSLLSRTLCLYQNNIQNLILVDSYIGALRIKNIISKAHKNSTKQCIIKFYERTVKLVNKYSIDILMHELIKTKIPLVQGGYLIIEKTETLTTIDVNSGSLINLITPRDTNITTNYLAISEVVNQIKLRNLTGVIIIDFIDFVNQNDQATHLEYLSKLIKKDDPDTKIIQVSELGLIEMVKPKQRQSIYDNFNYKCHRCDGLGHLEGILRGITKIHYPLITNIENTYQVP